MAGSVEVVYAMKSNVLSGGMVPESAWAGNPAGRWLVDSRMDATRTMHKLWFEILALLSAALIAAVPVEPALGQGASPLGQGAASSTSCAPSLQPGSPGTTTTGEGEPHNPASAPENLSNRLAQSDGVICPPSAVDPDIKLPTPQTGNTPVIPPPGSPGGDPTIRPK